MEIQDNISKAREIANSYSSDVLQAGAYFGAEKMAEWKDQQFKEYLEKKKDSLEMDYTKDCFEGNAYKHFLLKEIINEFFKED